ncbi:MAG: hypothetical protein AAEJ52_12575 [Myxococcota bacterium]
MLPRLLCGFVVVATIAIGGVADVSTAEIFIWIDQDGLTHISDDPSGVPDAAKTRGDDLGDLWIDPTGEAVSGVRPDRVNSRIDRLIQGAIVDLQSGETARATVALEAVLRTAPATPRAHWYLALLDRQRGRYDSARAHLEAFLAAAGDDLEPWRKSAQRRLAALVDEERLADPEGAHSGGPWRGAVSSHFRVHYDPQLGMASPDFAKTVLRYLQQARETANEQLGSVPEEPMGVVFYGKAAYLQAHRHRFSFQTIGFFDGRIHVVSAAHPAGELRALLFHEYSHAVFREKTGGDRPYWLNEGLAELSERAALRRAGLTRSERAALRIRIDAGTWISLRELAPSFSGLDDAGARAAYLESAAAADWIASRTTPQQREALLEMLGEGKSADAALRESLGVDTAGLDRVVQRSIREEFPPEVVGPRVPAKATPSDLRRARAKLRAGVR